MISHSQLIRQRYLCKSWIVTLHGGSLKITLTVPLKHSVFRNKPIKFFMWDILLSILMRKLIHNQASNALVQYKNKFQKYLVSPEIFNVVKTGFQANI